MFSILDPVMTKMNHHKVVSVINKEKNTPEKSCKGRVMLGLEMWHTLTKLTIKFSQKP